jgi:hypothetical protein
MQPGGNILQSEIQELIKSIWNKEELPQQWKESIIVPIYKKVDKTNCSNCTGISLPPTTYNNSFNILVSRLTPYGDERTVDHKCGF